MEHAAGPVPGSRVPQARDAGVAQAREQLRLAIHAGSLGEQGHLEGHGGRLLLAHADGAVDGAVDALSSPGHHAPAPQHRAGREQGGVQHEVGCALHGGAS